MLCNLVIRGQTTGPSLPGHLPGQELRVLFASATHKYTQEYEGTGDYVAYMAESLRQNRRSLTNNLRERINTINAFIACSRDPLYGADDGRDWLFRSIILVTPWSYNKSRLLTTYLHVPEALRRANTACGLSLLRPATFRGRETLRRSIARVFCKGLLR